MAVHNRNGYNFDPWTILGKGRLISNKGISRLRSVWGSIDKPRGHGVGMESVSRFPTGRALTDLHIKWARRARETFPHLSEINTKSAHFTFATIPI